MKTQIRRSTLLLPLAIAACSSGSNTPSGIGDPPAPTYDAKGCATPSDGTILPDAVCVRSLSATIVDDKAAPLSNFVTTACGDGCTFGRTDATGRASMSVHRYMRKPAIMLHGHSVYASYYVLLAGDGDIDRGTLVTPMMPKDGVVIPPDGSAADVTFGDVSFWIAAGTNVLIDDTELVEPTEQAFRALAVAPDKAPPFVDPTLHITTLYALTPFATKFDPGVKLNVANTAQLPKGAAVEFFIQGTDVKDKFGPFGIMSKAANGHVSDDGTKITTDEGESISELTWLGVRLKAN